jgi:hypothetical protein
MFSIPVVDRVTSRRTSKEIGCIRLSGLCYNVFGLFTYWLVCNGMKHAASCTPFSALFEQGREDDGFSALAKPFFLASSP